VDILPEEADRLYRYENKKERMMKIAVVTDDHRTISAHFGRATYYEVFTVEDGMITKREAILKPSHEQFAHEPHDETGYAHGQGPLAGKRHARMLEPIRDCQILLTRGMGQGAHDNLTQAGIQPILTEIQEIQPAVEAYLAGTIVDHPERLH
jgi:predicted Fe-Mo cluster-binding NifX family protein